MALKVEDRMTVFALFVIGGLTVLLGAFSIRHNIKATFYGDLGAAGLHLNTAEQEQLNSLKAKDTDGDGLSDYDELYAYNTSPYLKDSDSDGTDDKTEVATGTDPNCSGASCLQTRVGANANVPTTANTPGEAIANANAGTPPASATNSSALASLGANPSAADIRALLLNAGVSQQVLDQTDDATLLDLYQQTLATTNTNQPLDTNYSNLLQNQTITSPQDLANLTADQIRQLLISAGVDPAVLSQVSDADLLVIYKKAVSDAQAETATNSNTNL